MWIQKPKTMDNLAKRLGVDNDAEDVHLTKRFKTSALHSNQEWSCSSIQSPVPPAQYNPLNEPSPLGLKLRKSPSLLDLIQMKLYKTNASSTGTAPAGDLKVEKKGAIAPAIDLKVEKKGAKTSAASSSTDKMKASNFLALYLKIGDWEYVSRHEGDFVAKCYYSKHKLVWELLDDGLKRKIEIQWSDIVALKACCPDNRPGNLTLVLAKPPLFFKENNPEPRKHTLWQVTADFTDGQASMHRQHFLQFPQGVLNKHYEKLIQCDMRLKFLSQQPDIVLDTPYFVSPISGNQLFDQLGTAKVSPMSCGQIVASPFDGRSASVKIEQRPLGIARLHAPKETCLPSSGVHVANEIREGQKLLGLKNWEQSKVGLHQSMSMNDLVNHIEQQISEQMTPAKASECKYMLDNIAHQLLNDTQTMTALDEKSLMSRVNSLCSLIQQDPVLVPGDQPDRETCINGHIEFEPKSVIDSTSASMFEINTVAHERDDTTFTSYKQPPTSMPRNDSFGDLLLNLPRITSFPQLLYNISEDGDDYTLW